MNDPSTGPLSREAFKALVGAPHGQARKEIQKIDPLFGRAPGEKIKWRVRCSAQMEGTAYVMASSQKEAEAAADKLTTNDVDWDTYHDDFDIHDVDPDTR